MRKRESLKNEKIGKSAAKPRTAERSTTIPYGSRIASYWRFEIIDYL